MHLSRSFCSGSGGTLPIKIDICQGVSYMFSLMTYGLFVYMWNRFGMTREIHSLHIDYSICLKHLKKNRKNDAFEVVVQKKTYILGLEQFYLPVYPDINLHHSICWFRNQWNFEYSICWLLNIYIYIIKLYSIVLYYIVLNHIIYICLLWYILLCTLSYYDIIHYI